MRSLRFALDDQALELQCQEEGTPSVWNGFRVRMVNLLLRFPVNEAAQLNACRNLHFPLEDQAIEVSSREEEASCGMSDIVLLQM